MSNFHETAIKQQPGLLYSFSKAFDKVPHLHLLLLCHLSASQGHYSNGLRVTFPIVLKMSCSTATPQHHFLFTPVSHKGPFWVLCYSSFTSTPWLNSTSPLGLLSSFMQMTYFTVPTPLYKIWLGHFSARYGSTIQLDYILRLSINPTKSSLLITSRHNTKPQLSVTINTIPVTNVESVKYLLVTWNETLISPTCASQPNRS